MTGDGTGFSFGEESVVLMDTLLCERTRTRELYSSSERSRRYVALRKAVGKREPPSRPVSTFLPGSGSDSPARHFSFSRCHRQGRLVREPCKVVRLPSPEACGQIAASHGQGSLPWPPLTLPASRALLPGEHTYVRIHTRNWGFSPFSSRKGPCHGRGTSVTSWISWCFHHRPPGAQRRL